MKLLLLVLGILLLGLGGYLAFGLPGAVAGPEPAQTTRLPDVVERRAPEASVDEQPKPARLDAEVVNTLSVTGRCVTAVEARAIAGCLVRLLIGEDASKRRWRDWPAEDLAGEATTGADGRFSISIPAAATGGLAVQVRAQGYATRAGAWPRLPSGSVFDLGDIAMPDGISVTGTVREQSGDPVEGATFLLVTTEREEAARLDRKTMFRTVTDAAGRFELPGLVSPGEWYVGVENTGPLVSPRTVKLTTGTTEFGIDVRVETPDAAKTIRGVVVDELGQPLAGIRLNARGEGLMGRTSSGDDGRFVLPPSVPHHDDGKAGVRLSASDPKGQREPASSGPSEVMWGQQGLRIVMRELATLTLVVVDEAGRPVSDFDAQVMHRDLESGRIGPGPRAKVRGSKDGRCRLPRMRRGEHHLLVTPLGDRFGPNAVRRFTEIEGEMLVQLLARRPVEVLVVTSSDGAVVGSQVSIEQPLFDLSSRPAESGRFRPAGGGRLGGGNAFVTLDEGVTGTNGAATLSVAPGSWRLSVTGKLHVPFQSKIEVTRDMPAFRVVVSDAAILEGTAGPAAILSKLERPKILVQCRDPKEAAWGKLVDGAFEIASLPLGRYSVSAEFTLRSNPAHKGTVTVPLTEVELRAGGRRQLALDLRVAVPGSVNGQLRVDGRPLVDGHLFLVRQSAGGKVSVRARTDGAGVFHSRLPAGDYTVRLALPAQPGPGWNMLPLPEAFTVQPGEESAPRFDVRIRRIRVRLLHADGAPLVKRRIRLISAGYFRPGQLSTDADGWVGIEPAPLGEFRIEAPTIPGRPARTFEAVSSGVEFEIRAAKSP